MKNQFSIKKSIKLFFTITLLSILSACNLQTEKSQSQSSQTDENQQIKTVELKVEENQKKEETVKCEVVKKGQQVQNKLLTSLENMSSSMNKLHEVIEKHKHADITEHVGEVETYILALMKQSVYIPRDDFDTVQQRAKSILKLATQYAWDNKYYGFGKNFEAFKELEMAINNLKTHINEIESIPASICETEKNIAKKEMDVHLYVMEIYIKQIDKSADKKCFECTEKYCDKLEALVKTFRESSTNIDTRDFKTLNRTLAEIENVIHEVKENAEARKKAGIHHSHENLLKHIKRLKEEVNEVV